MNNKNLNIPLFLLRNIPIASANFIPYIGGALAYILDKTIPENHKRKIDNISKDFQIPCDISDFTGRNSEINELKNLLKNNLDNKNALKIINIHGMPGVGKSTLAIYIAHQIKQKFADFQLYANLQKEDTQNILTHWLSNLNQNHNSNNLEQLAKNYRSSLANKKGVILLDNAVNESQVRCLLPNSSSIIVLITSRASLAALEGVYEFPLNQMDKTEAFILLEYIVGKEKVNTNAKATFEIIEYCGGLPLALRISGGTLKKKTHWSLEEYAAKLANEKKRLKQLKLGDLDVRASLNIGYQTLTEIEQHRFRKLGILENSEFSVEIAAALLDLDIEITEEFLEKLLDEQLLSYQKKNRGYYFHDLIRLFVREILNEEESEAKKNNYKQRIIEYCFEFFSERVLPYESSNTLSIEDRLAIFNIIYTDKSHFLKALDWAIDKEDWIKVENIASNLIRVLGDNIASDKLQELLNILLSISRQQNNVKKEAEYLNEIGTIFENVGDWEKAIGCFEDAATHFGQEKEFSLQVISLFNAIKIYRYQNNCNQQEKIYKLIEEPLKKIKKFENLKDLEFYLTILKEIAIYRREKGENHEAIKLLSQAKNIAIKYAPSKILHGILVDLGISYVIEGQYKIAIENYEESIKTSNDIKYRSGKAITLINLANCYNQLEKYDEAIKCINGEHEKDGALVILRNMGNDPLREGIALTNLSIACEGKNDLPEAFKYIDESLALFKEKIDSPYYHHIALCQKANLYNRDGNSKLARRSWEEALGKLNPNSEAYNNLFEFLLQYPQ